MKHTGTIAFLAIALLVAASPAFSQAAGGSPGVADGGPGDAYTLADARRDFRKLDLQPADAAKIQAVLDKDSGAVELARAEIREAQARLARLMLEKKPDMEEIRKTVRASLESEYRVRMSQIERNMAIREAIGDDRWAALTRLSRGLAALSRKGEIKELAERAGDAEKLALLLELLKSLQ